MSRRFTLNQARALLPEVRAIAEAMRERKRAFDERDGRAVYLCWRIGEPDIMFWHELHAGFRGRQPI